MPALSTIIAGASLAVSAGSSAVQYSQSKKSIKQQNKALDYEKQQNDLAAMRQKRDAVRQARIAAATAQNTGATQGVSESSAAKGGVGSISSQLGDTLSFLDQWNRFSDQASAAIGSANRHAQKAQTAGSVASLSMGIFSNSDLIGDKVSGIFGKKKA